MRHTVALDMQLEIRNTFGKGGARKIRKSGNIPCVIVSSEIGSISLSINTSAISKMSGSPAFLATVFDVKLNVNGNVREMKIIPTKVDFHPVTGSVLHVDFLHIISDNVIVQVPVKIVGNEKAPGLKKGGKLNLARYHLPLKCKVNMIPEKVDINISTFGIGRSLFLSKLDLPEGSEMAYDCLILSIVGRGRKEKEEAESAVQSNAKVTVSK